MTVSPDKASSQKRRLRLGRLWVPVFVMIGVTVLSGTSGPQLGPISFAGIDKLGHFVVFGLLGIAWTRCFDPSGCRPALQLFLATSLTTLFGLVDELHQFGTPGRYFEWADLAADFTGALCWSASYLFIKSWQSFLELQLWDGRRLRSTSNVSNSG